MVDIVKEANDRELWKSPRISTWMQRLGRQLIPGRLRNRRWYMVGKRARMQVA